MLASALAALSTTSASLYTPREIFDEREITKREAQYGQNCGNAGNGASCVAGLCCSAEVSWKIFKLPDFLFIFLRKKSY